MDEEGDTGLDEDLRKMAGDISRKQMAGSKHVHNKDIDEDEEAEDGDGSMFEDLDEPLPAPAKRPGKAKSPAKSGPVSWPAAEIDGVRQNRYAVDRPEMRDYRRNYLTETDQRDFQLEEPLQVSRHHLVKARHHTRCGVHARGRAGHISPKNAKS